MLPAGRVGRPDHRGYTLSITVNLTVFGIARKLLLVSFVYSLGHLRLPGW